MTNELLDMSCSVVNSEKILSSLYTFLEYLIKHFEYEEKVIHSVGYLDYDKQVSEHKKLVSSLSLLIGKYHKKLLNCSDFSTIIVDDLIIGHIINEDVKFFPYIRNYYG